MGPFYVSGFRLGLSTQPVKLTNPSNLPEPEPEIAQTDHFDVGCELPPTEPNTFGLVAGFLPQNSSHSAQPKTFDDIRRIFDENLQKLMIFGVLRRKLLEIPLDLARFSPNLTRSREISSWSGQILMDSTKITSLAIQPETRWNPNYPIRLAFWVGFGFCFHPPESFRSSLSRAQIWLGSTRRHPYFRP